MADFGLALRHGEVLDASPAGSRPGTPLYMAPEMFADDATPGPPADQFSFCVALFEALHGIQPFPTTGLTGRLQASDVTVVGLAGGAPRLVVRRRGAPRTQQGRLDQEVIHIHF